MILGVVSPVGDQGGDIARTAVLAAGLPDTTGGCAAQPVLRVGPGGRQHGRAEGALRLGRPGARRRRRVDEPGADGLRRRRLGHRPRNQLPHRLRPAGHRRRPDRHHRGLLPRGRRRLRGALAGEGRRGVVGRLLRQVRRPGQRPERPGHPRPRRAHAPRLHAGGPWQAQDRVRRHRRDGRLRRRGAAEVPLGREDQPRPHRRQQLRHRRRRRAGARRLRKCGRSQGLTPRARIVATATSGSDPVIMLTGPTPATRKVLDRAGLTVDDIDLFELNEAFASVVLKFQKDLNIPDEKLNVNGGAIAMGHPLGATGAMITGTMVDELERRNARRALITLCIGGGMGVATIIERV